MAFAATALVVTVNVPAVAPLAMVADVGTVAAALPEVSPTDNPEVGAGELIVIVPVEFVPPTTVVGLSTRELTVGPVTANVAVADVEFAEAVIVAEELVATATVVMVKVPVVAPAGTEAVAGTVAAANVDDREMGSPPVGAALEIVTVPTELAPPRTDVGLRVRPVTVGPAIARLPAADVVPTLAEIAAVTFAATATVETVKVVEIDPAGNRNRSRNRRCGVA